MQGVDLSAEPATKEDIAMLAHVLGAVIFQTTSLITTFGNNPAKASEHYEILISLNEQLRVLADQIEGAV